MFCKLHKRQRFLLQSSFTEQQLRKTSTWNLEETCLNRYQSWELLSPALTSSLLSSNSCCPLSESLAHFMLVQIFMGSFIFIHSAPTRASFDTRDPLPWHLVYHAFLSTTLAFRGYRVFSCDVSGNWALLSIKRFLLFRRKNKVTDHVSENRHLVPYGTLHSIYQALVQPYLTNAILFGVTLQDKLQKLQSRAACILTYSNYDADVNNLFELLRWKSLVSQRQIERAAMVFKSLQGLAPEYLCSKIVHHDSGYCLRDSVNKVNVPQPRRNYCKKKLKL